MKYDINDPMTKIKVAISMDEEIFEDLEAVVGDEYNYGFQNRSHLISQAVKELLYNHGYYYDDDEEDQEDDPSEELLDEDEDEDDDE